MKTTSALLATLFLLTACNTFQGIGEDIEAAGEGLSNTAKKVENEISK